MTLKDIITDFDINIFNEAIKALKDKANRLQSYDFFELDGVEYIKAKHYYYLRDRLDELELKINKIKGE